MAGMVRALDALRQGKRDKELLSDLMWSCAYGAAAFSSWGRKAAFPPLPMREAGAADGGGRLGGLCPGVGRPAPRPAPPDGRKPPGTAGRLARYVWELPARAQTAAGCVAALEQLAGKAGPCTETNGIYRVTRQAFLPCKETPIYPLQEVLPRMRRKYAAMVLLVCTLPVLLLCLNRAPAQNAAGRQLTLTAGDAEVVITLNGSRAAAALVRMLPVEGDTRPAELLCAEHGFAHTASGCGTRHPVIRRGRFRILAGRTKCGVFLRRPV